MEEHLDFEFDFENTTTSNALMVDINQHQCPQSPQGIYPTHSYLEEKRDGKKIYICTVPECGKIFKFKSEVTRHMIIHNGNRPFNCTVEGCSKSFKRPDALAAHIRIHAKKSPESDEKPECDLKLTDKEETKQTNNNTFADSDKPSEEVSQRKKVKTTRKPDPNYFTFKDIEQISRNPEEITPGLTMKRYDEHQWIELYKKKDEYGNKINWKLFYKFYTFLYSVIDDNKKLREEFREKYHVLSNEEKDCNLALEDS